MKKLFLLSLPLMILASACTNDQGYFTVISNKIIDLKNLNLNTNKKTKNVTGKQEVAVIVVIPYGDLNPDLPGALNDCFKKYDADLLTDAHCYSTFLWIPYIYASGGYYVEGDAVKTRQN